MRATLKFIITSFLFACSFCSISQTIPVGTPLQEETWRRLQMSGVLDSNTSLTIRPINYTSISVNDSGNHVFNVLTVRNNSHSFFFARGAGKGLFLPVMLKQQYNSHHPYGWNDGSMIQARGYQGQLSFGLYSTIGPLSIQFQPELVYAQNRNFSTFPSTYSDSIWKSYYYFLNHFDNPEKYGKGAYAKLFPGQSSIRFNYRKLSLGVSSEDLWWGPGIRNSLIMSNNATGFQHITFNTVSPVSSPVGSFEWQAVSGILKSSGIFPDDTAHTYEGHRLYSAKVNDDRYFNGMVITWQPKWTTGLFLGMSRVFVQYESELGHSFSRYLPIVTKLFKGGNVAREDSIKKNQLLSIFFRLILPKEKAELYAEYGRNDHAANLRDLILEPEHSRAYIIGFRKLFETKKGKDVELFTEISNLQVPPTITVRPQGSWYTHDRIGQGYTNRGQVIGAGIGPGSNSQSIGLNWIKETDKFGVMLERVVWNNDFYFDAFAPLQNYGRHWVDVSLNLNKSWHRKHFIYNADLSLIRSLNYQWRSGEGKDVNNIHAGFSVSYLF
ncbi:capsule assembly Wzi family protein [Chitinophagaceae bacterium LB-8]|uniref:Capsule assembly Wzi family protein n=1 Tax=Paraflavisolibacter caeni TaxID=2982496 RepID=A0A9X3B6U0_9BACT|nr:capsule assembly Wzi family protein [Paraflavisolibacter caeni]MCU7548480.1 capsule assembly Wzi family protein [Paraflavisolibacter caeni]